MARLANGEDAVMSRGSLRRRKAVNGLMAVATFVAAVLATVPLLAILVYLVRQGASSVNVDFFLHAPKPAGEPGGGMGNAVVGTLIVVGMAGAIGLPVGIGAGLFLAEQRASALSTVVRFLADVLNGLPSIVMGIFAWALLVRPVHHFSALAGSMAL